MMVYSRPCEVKTIIPLIMLAAGLSTRFPGNKLLYIVNGEPLIHRVVRVGLGSNADEVILVFGYEGERIKKAVTDLSMNPKLRMVYNSNYELGMSTSVKAGLSHVLGRAGAVMFLPADVCLISCKPINILLSEYFIKRPLIAIASYKGRKGHPILFDKALFSEIMQMREESFGLKNVISKYRHEVLCVDVDEEEVLVDIDSPEELEEYIKKKRGFTDVDVGPIIDFLERV